MRRRNKNGDRRPYDDFEDEYEDDPPRYNRRNENRNKNRNDEGSRTNNKKNARPVEEDTPDDYDRPRKGYRRPPPAEDYYDDEKPVKEEKRSYDRRRNNNDDDKKVSAEDAPLIKPTGVSSIYNRPRTAPKIRPPVPKNEQEKFAYKTVPNTEHTPTTKDASLDEEYYEDYEEEPAAKKPATALVNRKSETPEPRRPFFKQSASTRDEVKNKTDTMASRPRGYSPKRPQDDEEEEVERPNFRRPFKRPKYGADKNGRYGSSNRKRPMIVDEYYDEEEEEKVLAKDKSKKNKDMSLESTTSTSTTSTTTTVAPTTTTTTTVAPLTTVSPKDRHEGVVRVVKRPFLPSRGGNPYVSRGLQPIGTKAAEHEKHNAEVSTPFISVKTDTSEELPLEYEEEEFEDEEELLEKEAAPEVKPSTTTTAAPREQKRTEAPFKPSPVLLKVNVNVRPKTTTTTPPHSVTEEANEAEIKSVSPRLPPFKTLIKSEAKSPTVEPKTTEKPKSVEQNPLEYINENEYDVTLNEALNPTLPNLPIRSFPTGFSSTSDSQFRNLHRNGPRYVVEGLAQESTDYTYQLKQPAPRQRFDAVPIYNSGGGAQFVNSNADYQGQFSQVSPSYHRPNARITQAQTRGFYHGI